MPLDHLINVAYLHVEPHLRPSYSCPRGETLLSKVVFSGLRWASIPGSHARHREGLIYICIEVLGFILFAFFLSLTLASLLTPGCILIDRGFGNAHTASKSLNVSSKSHLTCLKSKAVPMHREPERYQLNGKQSGSHFALI